MPDAPISLEVLAKRVKPVGAQLSKDPAQLLLEAVNFVKELAAIHLQFPDTQVPVGAKQEMDIEELVFFLAQRAPRNQQKVGRIFFVLPAPDHSSSLAAIHLKTRMAYELLFIDALAEAPEAHTEDAA